MAYKRESSSGLDILKIEFYIPRSPIQVLNFIYNELVNIHKRTNSDVVREYEEFRRYSDSTRIRYELIDAHVPGVAGREILYFGIKSEITENVFALIETSVEHPEKPVKKDCVRAEVHYALHFCEKLNDMCHVIALAYADPKGAIPKTLINLGLSRRVDFYKILKAEILKNTT